MVRSGFEKHIWYSTLGCVLAQGFCAVGSGQLHQIRGRLGHPTILGIEYKSCPGLRNSAGAAQRKG
jgi:hypothetical protein